MSVLVSQLPSRTRIMLKLERGEPGHQIMIKSSSPPPPPPPPPPPLAMTKFNHPWYLYCVFLRVLASLFCRFNFLFLKRFWLIMRVAVPGVCSKSLLLLVILIVVRAAGQWRKCIGAMDEVLCSPTCWDSFINFAKMHSLLLHDSKPQHILNVLTLT